MSIADEEAMGLIFFILIQDIAVLALGIIIGVGLCRFF